MSVKTERGMALHNWLLVLVVVGFFANIAIHMVPHYVQFHELCDIVEGAAAAGAKDAEDLYSHVEKGMQINNIRDLKIQEVLSVESAAGHLKAHLKYSRMEPVLGNLSLVANFDKVMEVGAR